MTFELLDSDVPRRSLPAVASPATGSLERRGRRPTSVARPRPDRLRPGDQRQEPGTQGIRPEGVDEQGFLAGRGP